MPSQAILAISIGLAFVRIKVRQVEAVLKIAGIEIGIAEFREQARLIGERRLKNKISDPPAQIVIRVNAVSTRIKLADAHRKIAIQAIGQKGAAHCAVIPGETVRQKAEPVAGEKR